MTDFKLTVIDQTHLDGAGVSERCFFLLINMKDGQVCFCFFKTDRCIDLSEFITTCYMILTQTDTQRTQLNVKAHKTIN